jgi:hypothetical protein
MKEITTGTYAGNGTLAFNLTTPSNVDSATVNVVGLSTGTTDDYDTDGGNALVTTPDPLTYTLKPGYYRLELTLAKTGFATQVVREVIVIWSGLTTTYTRALALNANVYTITYTFNDARVPVGTPPGVPPLTDTRDFAHNANFAHPGTGAGTPPQYRDSTNAVDPSKTFEGWFTDPSAGTQWFTAGTITKVLHPETLFAHWGSANAEIRFSISVSFSGGKTITFDDADDPSPNPINGGTGTQTSPPELTFRVDAATKLLFTAPTYTWHYGDGTSLGTADRITVDFSSDPKYIIKGPHYFNVEIKDGQEYYNATVTVTIS